MNKLLPFLICLFLAIACQAEIIIVDDDGPADFDNIQAAINDSNDDDIIVVFPGIYTGDGNRDIDFLGKAITVCSVAPDDPYIVAATVIDCGGLGRGFYFHNGEDTNSVLDGLTITNGYANYGGGIYAENDSGPTITNCIISGNSATWEGGGVYGCAGPVNNCTITGNWVGDRGGGLAFCTGPITKCTISNNTAQRDTGGLTFCDGPIINCTISGNRAQQEDTGGLGACGDIINCVITGNSAGQDAGAIGGCYGSIINCIISGNSAGERGGALRYCYGPVTNCTITGNFAGWRGGAMYGCDGVITNCIISDNRSGDSSVLSRSSVPLYSCVQGGSYGAGCIDSDPCFVVPGYWDNNGTPNDIGDDFWVDGDYHLRPDSPCIDGGDYYYSMSLPSADLDEGTRLVASQIDMGCYEFNSPPDGDGDWLADSCEPGYTEDPDRDGDGIYDGLELLRGTDANIFDPLGQWNVPADANTIQQALFFSRSGETIVLSEGTYYENIHIGGRNIILAGTEPNNPGVVAATVVNGDTDANSQTASGRVVTFAGSEDANCQLRGLTITGGYDSASGGGIAAGRPFYSYAAGPPVCIIDCAIVGNSGWSGGGLHNCDGLIKRCRITSNSSQRTGGGLYDCDARITDCIITSNSAGGSGGGLGFCRREITNCTIGGNSAVEGGGGLKSCDGPITNCIIWDNSAPALSGCPAPTYSCVQGGWPGLGNIDADPCFVEPGDWVNANDPNIVVEPNDPNAVWVDGDYHLKSQGWRWDNKFTPPRWKYDYVTSRCIDAGNPGSPLGDEPLNLPDEDPNNDWGENLRINMGAYGGTAEASMPPYDWALLADLTNDGIVNFEDFAYQAEDWRQGQSEQPGDLDRNGVVDFADLFLLTEDWLKQTSWHE